MDILRIVRSIRQAACYVGAGAVRDSVWDALSNTSNTVNDIDVVFFDPLNLTDHLEQDLEDKLFSLAPQEKWDVKNQARVHLWFDKTFGYAVEPLISIEDAVATWPEYASAIAIRLTTDDTLDVVAPYGLADLMSMQVRRNPRRVTVEKYRERIARKKYSNKWPSVRIQHE